MDIDHGVRPGDVDRLLDGAVVTPARRIHVQLADRGVGARRHHHRDVFAVDVRRAAVSEQGGVDEAHAAVGQDHLIPIAVLNLAEHVDRSPGGQRSQRIELGPGARAHSGVLQGDHGGGFGVDHDIGIGLRDHDDAALAHGGQPPLGEADETAIGELGDIVFEIGGIRAVLDRIPEGNVESGGFDARAVGADGRVGVLCLTCGNPRQGHRCRQEAGFEHCAHGVLPWCVTVPVSAAPVTP